MAGFVVLDTFTAADGTALTSHTPSPLGTGWTEQVRTGAESWEINGNEVDGTASELSDRVLTTISDAPSTAEYNIVVRLELMDVTGDDPFFLIGRFTDTSNYYLCSLFSGNDAADKRLHKNVAATITELASGDAGSDSDERVIFEITDARKAMFFSDAQGTPTISSTDDALTSVGIGGIALGNFINATDDIEHSWHLEDFAVIDIEDLECFDDFFEAGADVTLTSHTADTGEAWTLEEQTGSVLLHTDTDNSGTEGVSEASDRILYTIGRTLTDAEYKIEFYFNELATENSTDDPIFAVARFADTSNFYFGGTYVAGAAADKKIYKEVSTTVTELASGDAGGLVDSHMIFEILGATKKIFWNDSEIISTTDDVITAKGEVGLALGNLAISTDDIPNAARMGLFVVSDISAAAGGRIMSSIAGAGGLASMGGIAGQGGGLAA